jgi:hypothetical protein
VISYLTIIHKKKKKKKDFIFFLPLLMGVSMSMAFEGGGRGRGTVLGIKPRASHMLGNCPPLLQTKPSGDKHLNSFS